MSRRVPATAPRNATDDEFAAVLSVDLVGVWRCLKFEARHMTARHAGCFVNTSSMPGLVGMAENAAYTAAKHGAHGLTRSEAEEIADAVLWLAAGT